jgi:hypothetical protein
LCSKQGLFDDHGGVISNVDLFLFFVIDLLEDIVVEGMHVLEQPVEEIKICYLFHHLGFFYCLALLLLLPA